MGNLWAKIMLRGANSINLDSKGRFAIPSRYRDNLITRCDGKMVVTVNNTRERCLWLYPMDEWEKVEEKLVALPSFEPSHQKLKRFLLGYAADVEMDGNGRILLSSPLRKFAMMTTKEIYLVGQGNKFEIWSESLWHARQSEWLDEEPEAGGVSVEMERLSL